MFSWEPGDTGQCVDSFTRHNPVFFFLFLHPFRHPFGAASQDEKILGAAGRTEMAAIKQKKKVVPIITCDISFSQYVCDLVVFGVSVMNLEFRVQIDSVEQPVRSNFLGSGNMSHCKASLL